MFSSPSRKIFTGGMRMPSPKIVFAPVGSEPGSGPPASIWCPNMLAQPISSPSQKIGRQTSQSLMCEIVPPHLYGSELRITSPSTIGSSKVSSISEMYEPNWPTTIRPCGSVIIGNSSCCSRITGLIAVRKSVASISKRVDLSAPSMMSSVTGSTSIFGNLGDVDGGHGYSFPAGLMIRFR